MNIIKMNLTRQEVEYLISLVRSAAKPCKHETFGKLNKGIEEKLRDTHFDIMKEEILSRRRKNDR